VTLAVAKRREPTQQTFHKMCWQNGFPARLCVADDVQVTVTRNYGQTAKYKSDELLNIFFWRLFR